MGGKRREYKRVFYFFIFLDAEEVGPQRYIVPRFHAQTFVGFGIAKKCFAVDAVATAAASIYADND
jgi:hypothetical protein